MSKIPEGYVKISEAAARIGVSYPRLSKYATWSEELVLQGSEPIVPLPTTFSERGKRYYHEDQLPLLREKVAQIKRGDLSHISRFKYKRL